MTDYIDRQAVIDAVAEHEKSKGHNYSLFVDIVSECAEIIRDIPPACQWIQCDEEMPEELYEVYDPKTLLESFREAAKQRPHGQWELHEDDSWSGGGFTKCSACGYGFAWGAFFEAEEWEFCPICGAIMDLKGEPHEQN